MSSAPSCMHSQPTVVCDDADYSKTFMQEAMAFLEAASGCAQTSGPSVAAAAPINNGNSVSNNGDTPHAVSSPSSTALDQAPADAVSPGADSTNGAAAHASSPAAASTTTTATATATATGAQTTAAAAPQQTDGQMQVQSLEPAGAQGNSLGTHQQLQYRTPKETLHAAHMRTQQPGSSTACVLRLCPERTNLLAANLVSLLYLLWTRVVVGGAVI